MPVLPLIDALILAGWSSLFAGFLLKAVYVTTSFRPTPFGMSPSDFLFAASVCLLFALALAARTWVKAHEPEMLARRRRMRLLEANGYDESEQPSFGRPRIDGDEDPRSSAAG